MNLAIDIGNTRTKLGLFAGDALVRHDVWPHPWNAGQLSQWLTNQSVENVILSTVGNDTPPDVEALLRDHYRCWRLDAGTPLPVTNRYRTPQTLGKDRLAAVVGAFGLFPNQDCLVIDAGTCITYDVLDRSGAYLGGNIAPGVRMRLRAMHAFTARLPLVEPADTPDWLGDSTESALRNGGQLGAVLEMEAFIALCRSKYGRINVILTGGDADYFAEKLKSEIFVNHHLVLLGLNKILTYNVKRLE